MSIKERLFAPTPKKIRQLLLALKGFIGSVSVGAIFQDKPYWACGFLIAGAFIDFLLNFLFAEK